MGIVIAAPNADAIIFAMNFERSTGLIHTAVNGKIAGHEAPAHAISANSEKKEENMMMRI